MRYALYFFVFFFSALITDFLVWQATRENPQRLIWALIPMAGIAFYSVATSSTWFLLIAALILCEGVSEYIYSRHIVKFKVDDLAVTIPSIAIFASIFLLGSLDSAILTQVYSAILQSTVTVIGLAFALGLFVLESFRGPSSVKAMLSSLVAFFTLTAVLSLFGLMFSKQNADFSMSILSSATEFGSMNSFSCTLFVCTTCFFLSSILYVFVAFSAFVKKKQTHKSG